MLDNGILLDDGTVWTSDSACWRKAYFAARKPTPVQTYGAVTAKAFGFLSNPLADINAFAVRIGEDECALAIIPICQ